MSVQRARCPSCLLLLLTVDTEYAAAFFLLADHLKDAVGVLANQLDDMQLAIAVARVYEGDEGPVLKELIHSRILPQAVREGNKFLASWAFSMLGQRDMAIQALTVGLPLLTRLDCLQKD